MNRKTELLARAYFVVIVFTMIALVIAYRVIVISVVEGDKWRQKGAANVKWINVDADRGNIYSDDESLLATSLQFFEIRLDLNVASEERFMKNLDSLAYALSSTIRPDLTPNKWRQRLLSERKAENGYFLIKKEVDREELDLVKGMPLLRHGRYGGGLRVERYSKRVKPYREFASRTIGVDRINAQKVGLEGYFDNFLSGPTDKRLMKKVSSTSRNGESLWIPVYDPSEFTSRRGDDIKTTLNMHLQDVTHTELADAVINYDAREGVAILMEVKTGAIKAISNLTNYDGVVHEVRNTAVGSSTEPGSTFKLASVLALMEDSLADLDTKVDLNGGKWKFYDRTMRDSDIHGKGEVTMKTAFAISSNVGIARLAHRYYNQDWEGRKLYREKLSQFGLDMPLGIEIEGEGKPNVKDPVKDRKRWYGTTIPWMSHGYEISMTPLQMLNLYNTVANNGKMMKPYLVSDIIREDGKVKHIKPKVLKSSIARPDVIQRAREMLEEVVLTGTAKHLNSGQVNFAGKTGTTRVNYVNKDEYAKYNASFCGYFPADDPLYSLIVVLYAPKKAYYGSAVAGPVFKSIAEKTMAWRHEITTPINMPGEETVLKNNTPEGTAGYKEDFKKIFEYTEIRYKDKTDKPWVEVDPFESKMLIEEASVSKTKVPDVRGMGARDAMFVLENLGMKVAMHGRGKVVRQTIRPGTKLNKQSIEIYLN
jgi:cell division protein FtsI (penicillin-binding protein 3)